MEREDIIHYLKTAEWHTARFGANVRFFRGDTLVRYIEIPFFDGMEDAVNWLNSEEGCEEIFVDGKRPDIRWKPLRAWYEDSGTFNNRSWRLYHAVRNADDDAADGPYTVEDDCVYTEEHTFFWRTAEVMEVPKGSSGISYSLQGIRRDEESGLFSYVLVKRERVQVNVGPWLSHQELGETRESALLLGVREEEGSSVDDKIAAFASEHQMKTTDGDGSVVDIQKSKNDDCTTDVTLVNTKEEKVAGAVTVVRETAFANETATTDRNTEPAEDTPEVGEELRQERTPGGKVNVVRTKVTPKAVDGAIIEGAADIFSVTETTTDRNKNLAGELPTSANGDGTIRRVRSEMTAEGKHNVTESIEREISVPRAVTVVRETAFANETATTDRNTEPAEDTPEVGEELRQERTPGGKVNVVRTKVTPKEAQAVVETSSSDAFSSSTTTTYRNAEEPASAEEFGSASAQPNELGRYDGQVTHETPKPEVMVGYASRKTAFAEYRTTTYRNATSPKEASANGESASASPNRLGRVDGELTEVFPTLHSAGSAGIGCEKTIYEHRHTKTGRNLDAIPNGGEAEEQDKASGKTYRLSAQLNEFGKYDTEEVETTELKVPNYRTSKQETALSTVIETSGANDPLPPEDPSASTDGMTVKIDKQITPSGRTTWNKQEVTAKAVLDIHTFDKDSSGRKLQVCVFQNQKELPGGTWTGGSFRKNEFGRYDGQFSYSGRDSSSGGQDAWEQSYSLSNGKIFTSGKKVFKLTVTMTYVQGVLHDNDPSDGSSQSAAARLQGCNDGDISYLGDGWWSYKGYKNKQETIEQIGTISDDGSNFFSTSW